MTTKDYIINKGNHYILLLVKYKDNIENSVCAGMKSRVRGKDITTDWTTFNEGKTTEEYREIWFRLIKKGYKRVGVL